MGTGVCPAGLIEGVDSIQTNNYANARLDYYYYLPSIVSGNRYAPYSVLVMIPGLSGRGEHFVSREFKKFADQENLIIVAPSFVWDEKNWNSKLSYQYLPPGREMRFWKS